MQLYSDTHHIWESTYKLLEQNEAIVDSQLRTWIQPLDWVGASSTEPDLYVLETANDFTAQWIEDHHRHALETALSQVVGRPSKIKVVANPSKTVRHAPLNPNEPVKWVKDGADSGAVLSAGRSSGPRTVDNKLDPRYSFDDFVVGASNQFAHASAIAVAEAPGHRYNPLFIYSPPGLGKTHLCHAIGNQIMARNPRAKVVYVSAETFMNELIESIQKKRMPDFREKYRNTYDCLLIDDVQFIAGRTSTEEEFFHTFNTLYGSKRQIVLTSDRPPKDIEKLENRIRSRFEWGLVADIQPPEIETRIAILKAKAERDDIYLPDDVATFIANHVKSNVRELEGILIRLQAQASLSGAEISLEMAKHELRSFLPAEGNVITVETIQEVVSRHFNIRVKELKSESRNKSFSFPRQIAMYLVRKYTNLGLKDIGSHFGGKNHSTIVHGCTKIEKHYENDDEVRRIVEEIQNQL